MVWSKEIKAKLNQLGNAAASVADAAGRKIESVTDGLTADKNVVSRYFVSYAWSGGKSTNGFGNAIVQYEGRLDSAEGIAAVGKMIESSDPDFQSVTILNFKYLGESAEKG